MIKLLSLCSFGTFLFLNSWSVAQIPYTITDLGKPGRVAVGARITNQGHVLFGFQVDSLDLPSHRFFFDGLTYTDVTSVFTSGPGLNDAGTMVGVRSEGSDIVEVYRYTVPTLVGAPNTVLTQLSGLGSRVFALNNNGTYAGAMGSQNNYVAFIADSANEVKSIGTLGGATSMALAINDLGIAIGVSSTGATPEQLLAGMPSEEAFRYQGNSLVGLGTLGGGVSIARAINELGQIVGDSSIAGTQDSHAFLYTDTHGMQDIGPTELSSVAYDINDFGVVVGQQYDPSAFFPSKAFLYDIVNGVRFLGDLIGPESGWTSFASATGINNHGQIVGVGVIGGENHIFLLSPIPEPAMISLFCLALTIVYVLRAGPNSR